MVGNEGDFFPVKTTQKRRRGDFIERPSLTDGQNELREHCANVRRIGFCFSPQEISLSSTLGGKINFADDVGAVEVSEKVLGDFVFERLFL